MILVNQINEQYHQIVQKRELLMTVMTDNEQEIFIKIGHELSLTRNNLSGFFFLAFPHSYLMKTPDFVWQLWLYHRYIHNQTEKQGKDYPILSLERIYADMCVLIEKGYLNMHEGCNQSLLKYLLIEWVKAYKRIGVLVDKTTIEKEIRYDVMPIFEQIQDNISIEIFYNLVLPHYKGSFDFQDTSIPRDFKKAVYVFQNQWVNQNNGYKMKHQFKMPNIPLLSDQIIIYTDNKKVLETAITCLTEEQKKMIADCIKTNPKHTVEQICETLIQKFNLNPIKTHEGQYEIYPFVDEYIFSSLWLWT